MVCTARTGLGIFLRGRPESECTSPSHECPCSWPKLSRISERDCCHKTSDGIIVKSIRTLTWAVQIFGDSFMNFPYDLIADTRSPWWEQWLDEKHSWMKGLKINFNLRKLLKKSNLRLTAIFQARFLSLRCWSTEATGRDSLPRCC